MTKAKTLVNFVKCLQRESNQKNYYTIINTFKTATIATHLSVQQSWVADVNYVLLDEGGIKCVKK